LLSKKRAKLNFLSGCHVEREINQVKLKFYVNPHFTWTVAVLPNCYIAVDLRAVFGDLFYRDVLLLSEVEKFTDNSSSKKLSHEVGPFCVLPIF
jgi:hypothetical protein